MILFGVLLVGCASPSSENRAPEVVVAPPASVESKIVKPPIKPRLVSKPRPKLKPKPAVVAQSEEPVPSLSSGESTKKQPTPSAGSSVSLLSISSFVSAGELESSDAGQLVFAGKNAEAEEDQGLFEDAILLSRVRAGLAAVAEPALASAARVTSGTVTLDVPSNFEPKSIGTAVDTALNTTGVRKVQVVMTSN